MMDMLHGRGMRQRIALGLAAAGIAAAAAVGCSPVPPDLDPAASRELQSRVLAVTSAAASGDPATGLRALDELVDHVTRAAADGEVSFKRHQSIMKAVETVRPDLRSAVAAKAASAKAAAEKAAAAKAAAEKAAADKATADAAAQAAATGGAAVQSIPAPPVPATSVTAAPPPRTPPAEESAAEKNNAAEDNRAKGADKGKGRKEG
ncbi:mucin-associated surface protein [Arthrobacter sp. NPDC093125]|uniref:mucin-associated surface protein n=1 Tax=Arthrobacter sp. NPDC093125 TaxID=3363944 RepID=UPI00382D9FEE